MKSPIIAGLVFAALSCGLANAECTYPRAPSSLPDGMTATQAEMVAGMESVKQYNVEVTEYLQCLDQETTARLEAAGENAPKKTVAQIKAIYTKRHNAAVEELEAHAARFNEQVKAFKARGDKS